jgi:hypothetical protein
MEKNNILYLNNIPKLKKLAKMNILNYVIIGKIKWKYIKEKKVLPDELIEYIEKKFDYYSIHLPSTNEALETFKLKGHSKPITCINIDKQFVITGSNDKTARIWNLEIQKCINVLEHKEPITYVYLDIISQIAITITSKTIIYFWNISGKTSVINMLYTDVPILNIVKINKEGNIALRNYNNVYIIIDLKTLQNTHEIDSCIFNIVKSKNMKIDIDYAINVAIDFISKIEEDIMEHFNKDNIRDIYITTKGYCLIICQNNIILYSMKNGFEIIWIEEINDNETLLMVKEVNDSFVLLSQLDNNIFKIYYNYNRINESMKCILLNLPQIMPNAYKAIDLEYTEKGKKIFILVNIYIPCINLFFWEIISIVSDIKAYIQHSLSKPIIKKNKIFIVPFCINELVTLIQIMRSNTPFPSVPYAYTHNGLICYNSNYGKVYYNSIRISRILFPLTLEQSLLYNKIIKYDKKQKHIKYSDRYKKILMSMDKSTYISLIHRYKDVLSKYITCNLKIKSLEVFHKSFNDLTYIELCKIYNFENCKTCE